MITPTIKAVSLISESGERLDESELATESVVRFVFQVGAKGMRGTDTFDIQVATAKGLSMNGLERSPRFFSRLLVVDVLEAQLTQEWIFARARECSGHSWEECASKLSRYFNWEYERVVIE